MKKESASLERLGEIEEEREVYGTMDNVQGKKCAREKCFKHARRSHIFARSNAIDESSTM